MTNTDKRGIDKVYQDLIGEAVMGAILKASIRVVDGKKIGVLRSAEITHALLMICAFVSAGCKATSTPQKTRILGDQLRRDFIDLVRAAQNSPERPLTVQDIESGPLQ
jgi:hypothetical protein